MMKTTTLKELLNNLVGCGTYGVVDNPSNRLNFLDCMPFENILNNFGCQDAGDLESKVDSFSAIDELPLGVKDTFISNDVDLSNYTHCLYLKRLADEFYYLAWV